MNNKKDDKAWQHVLKESRKNKEWAKNHEHADNPDAWKASMMSVEMLKKYLNTSVEDLAEERYRYFYMRAHATAGVFSRPIDPEAKRKWEKITGKPILEVDSKKIEESTK